MTVESTPAPEHRTQSSSPKIYYTCVDSKVEGPYSIRELLRMRESKQLRSTTLCGIEGAKEWQTLEVLLTHKLGKRKMKRVQRNSFTSFSQKTLPTLAFGFMGLIALGMGIIIAVKSTSAEFFGYALVGVAFVLFIAAYFIHPKSES